MECIFTLTGRPLSLSDVWTPFLPVLFLETVLLETLLFLGEDLGVVDQNHDGLSVTDPAVRDEAAMGTSRLGLVEKCKIKKLGRKNSGTGKKLRKLMQK